MKLKLRQLFNALSKTDSQIATEVGQLQGKMIPSDLITRAADRLPITAIDADSICKWLSQQFGKEIKPEDIDDLKVHPASMLPDDMSTEAMTSYLQAQGYRITAPGLQEEPLYQEGDYLAGELAPNHWKSLANRRVPWPAGVDPKIALHEMAPFLTYRLLSQEAQSQGRAIGALIGPDEQI